MARWMSAVGVGGCARRARLLNRQRCAQAPPIPPIPRGAGHFEVLSKDVGVPVVAFRLKKVEGSDGKQHHRLYDEFALADRLRMRGWVLPGAWGWALHARPCVPCAGPALLVQLAAALQAVCGALPAGAQPSPDPVAKPLSGCLPLLQVRVHQRAPTSTANVPPIQPTRCPRTPRT